MKSPFLRILFLIPLTAAGYCQKTRIAVFPFNDRTTANKDINIGVKVADALVSKLSETGSFIVIDRENLQRLMEERNLKFDPEFNPAGAPKSGLMDVIDVLVTGQVDEFNANEKSVETSNYISKKVEVDGETSIKVSARLISVQTGQILTAPYAGTEKTAVLAKSSDSILLQNIGKKSGTANADAALQKLVDQAVDELTDSLAKKIAASPMAAPTPAAPAARSLKAKFVGIDDGAAVINKGATAGVRVGDKFSLVRTVNTGMKDPDTGNPIVRHRQVCEFVVASVEETLATGKCVGAAPQPGDEANLVP